MRRDRARQAKRRLASRCSEPEGGPPRRLLSSALLTMSGSPASDSLEGGKDLCVGLRQRMQVALGGRDLSVAHPLRDGLQIRPTGQRPRRVRMPEVVEPHVEAELGSP